MISKLTGLDLGRYVEQIMRIIMIIHTKYSY
jgi:hypothetical protein